MSAVRQLGVAVRDIRPVMRIVIVRRILGVRLRAVLMRGRGCSFVCRMGRIVFVRW
jgi:hypothetical protein